MLRGMVTWFSNLLLKEWVLVHGEWIGAQDKQILWTAKLFSYNLFVECSNSFPMNPEKKTLIPYIYNAHKRPFLKFTQKSYKLQLTDWKHKRLNTPTSQ